MMAVVKKNQIIVLLVGTAMVVAAYLTYANNTTETLPVIDEISDPLLTEKIDSAVFADDGIFETDEPRNSSEAGESDNSSRMNESTYSENSDGLSYFDSVRLERDNAREDAISLQQLVLNSTDESSEAYVKAQEELAKIADRSEKEVLIESIIKGKGFEDAVVFIENASIYVIVDNNGEELEQSEANVIKNAVTSKVENEYDVVIQVHKETS